MLEQIKAVIFDLDGTLVDSMWMWKAIDEEYLGRYGLDCPEDLQPIIEGMSFSETAQYFKKRFQLEDTVEQIKADWNELAYEKYMQEVPLKPGASDFLRYLKSQGVRTGIATSNSATLANAVLKQLNIRSYFDAVHTSCEVAKGKPAPDIYLHVAKKLCTPPGECFVFEDLVAGIQAGKRAGMKTCAIYDAYSKHQEEEKRMLADYYIQDFTVLLQTETACEA